jgi:hypothetical protein
MKPKMKPKIYRTIGADHLPWRLDGRFLSIAYGIPVDGFILPTWSEAIRVLAMMYAKNRVL